MTKLILSAIFALGCSAFAAEGDAPAAPADAASAHTKHHHKTMKKETTTAPDGTKKSVTTMDDKGKDEGHKD